MKILLITAFLLSSIYADEMQRIESIVKDIQELRKDYEQCQKRLEGKTKGDTKIVKYQENRDDMKRYGVLLKDEKEKNSILKDEIDSLYKQVSVNKKIMQKFQKQLKTKEKENINLKNELLSLRKTTSKNHKPLEICLKEEDKNSFPKLIPKENLEKDLEKDSKIQFIKASVFRLKNPSSIYDSPYGVKIDSWEKDTSFTSNKQKSNWIKITGYFVDQKWRKAEKEMWIRKRNIVKR